MDAGNVTDMAAYRHRQAQPTSPDSPPGSPRARFEACGCTSPRLDRSEPVCRRCGLPNLKAMVEAPEPFALLPGLAEALASVSPERRREIRVLLPGVSALAVEEAL